ncbi:glycosyl hydrolase [candidate division KSB1 bacterium]|nr:glycosyl hydrolase [candidate division KSB1 bacterium]
MPSKSRKNIPLAGVDFSSMSRSELDRIFLKILYEGIHGISFSVYLENQAPGAQISAEQIKARMKIIQPYIKWIRSFSCIDGNELIPGIAHEYGLKTLVGAWLGTDAKKNEIEIEGVIKVGKAGHADIIAVGNEVLLRGDLLEIQIIEYIERVKSEVPGVPVGYVDAYYEFTLHPRISNVCDVILANCYPFWEGYPLEHSLLYLKDMYHRAVKAGNGKKVIISETGWPNRGSAERGAKPSYENALIYFINAYQWAVEEDIEIFYFSSFDEAWKIAAEGDVGAYWGLWDKDGKLKYG